MTIGVCPSLRLFQLPHGARFDLAAISMHGVPHSTPVSDPRIGLRDRSTGGGRAILGTREDRISRLRAILVGGSLLCCGCSTPPESGGTASASATTSTAPTGGHANQAARGTSSADSSTIHAGLAAGAHHAPPSEFDSASGPKVTVSCTLALEGVDAADGVLFVDVEVYQVDQRATTRLVHSIELAEPGAWSFEAPAGFGRVLVHGFLDLNDNGPGPGEPMGGAAPFIIADVDIRGIELVAKPQPPADAGDLPPNTMLEDEEGLPVSTAGHGVE